MIQQIEFQLPTKRRGCHLITGEITRQLPNPLPKYKVVRRGIAACGCDVWCKFKWQKQCSESLESHARCTSQLCQVESKG